MLKCVRNKKEQDRSLGSEYRVQKTNFKKRNNEE